MHEGERHVGDNGRVGVTAEGVRQSAACSKGEWTRIEMH